MEKSLIILAMFTVILIAMIVIAIYYHYTKIDKTLERERGIIKAPGTLTKKELAAAIKKFDAKNYNTHSWYRKTTRK